MNGEPWFRRRRYGGWTPIHPMGWLATAAYAIGVPVCFVETGMGSSWPALHAFLLITAVGTAGLIALAAVKSER